MKPAAYAATAFCHRALAAAGLTPNRPPVGVVVERADWAIRWWGTFTTEAANAIAPGMSHVVTDAARLTSGVIEFGSQYQWVEWGRFLSPRCRMVSTFFHGKPEDGPEVARHIDRFLESVPRLDRIVASASIVRDRLRHWGVPDDKIVLIPIGCETSRFVPPSEEEREAQRARFGISPHEIVIGSFQKDGVGWGDGMTPKRIKGPDAFLAAIDRLAKDLPIFVLLSGPARGYVRAGLDRIGVRHAHYLAPDRDALAKLYHALDLYLITSREEGGPMALMESMASGVLVVSTRVGMAPDLIINRETGALVDVDDIDALVACARGLVALPDRGASLKAAAREAVKAADWSEVGRRHLEEIWRPLLSGAGR